MAVVIRCDVCGTETAAQDEGWGILEVRLSRARPTGDHDPLPLAGSRTLEVCRACGDRAQAGLAVVDRADVAMVLIRAAATKEGPDA
jgi:hypothetical protein